MHQQRNIPLACSKWRDVHGNDPQAMVELGPEVYSVYQLLHIDAGLGQDTHVHWNWGLSPEAFNGALLEHMQQGGLQLR